MTYKLNLTPQEMKNVGFRYDMSSELYTYEFPVYKSKNKVLLWCKLVVEEDCRQIRISIYDVNKRLYPAYYNGGRIMGLKTETITIRVTEEQKELIKKMAVEKDWSISKLLYNMLIKNLSQED